MRNLLEIKERNLSKLEAQLEALKKKVEKKEQEVKKSLEGIKKEQARLEAKKVKEAKAAEAKKVREAKAAEAKKVREAKAVAAKEVKEVKKVKEAKSVKVDDKTLLKQVYDELLGNRTIVNIYEIREALGWDKDRLDNLLIKLRQEYKINVSGGDSRYYTEEQKANSFFQDIGTGHKEINYTMRFV